jgi:taurine dioxygenase
MSALIVTPLVNAGAAVTGVDWSQPIAEEIAAALYAAWLEHGVLVFPRAGTSPEIQLRLSRVFGELEPHPLEALRIEGYEELCRFGDQDGGGAYVDGERLRGFIYAHQDTAYTPNLCKGSMLRMIELPERGGDTLFWDTAKSWRDLPRAMQERLKGLSTIQMMRVVPPLRTWGMPGMSAVAADIDKDRGMGFPDEWPLVLQPMVITHPESGLQSLLLSPNGYVRIESMAQAESDALFEEIACHVMAPAYRYRHKWSVGDMVLWDNRRMLHMAEGWPYDQVRYAHRTTLKGGMEVGRYYTTADGQSTMSSYV